MIRQHPDGYNICTQCHRPYEDCPSWPGLCNYCFTPEHSFGDPFYDPFFKEACHICMATSFDRVMRTNKAQEIREAVLARIKEFTNVN